MSRFQITRLTALFMLCYCSLPQAALARGSKEDEQEIERIANIELHEADKVRETVRQFTPALMRVVLSPDSEETRALKGPAHFFLRFFPDREFGDIPYEYLPLEDSLYIRMPRYEPEFRAAMLRSIRKAHEDISRRWEELGLTPPSGFIYVWIFSEVGQMKDEFAQYYTLQKTTRAFAVPCRFLIVPYASIPYSQYRRLQEDAKSRGASPSAIQAELDQFLEKDFTTSLAHELTHVYVNSTLGLRASQEFGQWFHEAIAIWMSRDSQELLPVEYKDYEYLFDFLRMKYGNERFLTFIRQSIAHKSVERSLESTFGIASQADLRAAAATWRANNKTGFLIVILSVAGLAMIGFARLMSGQTVFWFVPLSVSIVALYAWWSGVINLHMDPISHSKALNYVAMGLIFWAPMWKVWRSHAARTFHEELRKAEGWIQMGIAKEAGFYSSSQFNKAQNQLADARDFGSRRRFMRGISYARQASKMAESSVAAVSENRKKVLDELERSFQELDREIQDVSRKLDLARMSMDSSTIDLDLQLLTRFGLKLNANIQKSRKIQSALKAGHLATVKSDIQQVRVDVARLKESVTQFLLD